MRRAGAASLVVVPLTSVMTISALAGGATSTRNKDAPKILRIASADFLPRLRMSATNRLGAGRTADAAAAWGNGWGMG